MLQESDMDIQRSPQSTETGKDGVEMVQKGPRGAEEGLEIEEAGLAGKRSRLRVVAIVTALFVRLTVSLPYYHCRLLDGQDSQKLMLALPTDPSHLAFPLRFRSRRNNCLHGPSDYIPRP